MADDAGDAELRTFLIADVRGYTSFTQRHGDEAAAKLAAKFARVARDVVEQHQGRVLELRGDEALCVFVSPRQAVRCAIALQRRFVEETSSDAASPLPVGIGIDVGEAVPVEGGYRSGALNLAARLCSIARPGEILASPELAHLARQLDGMSYAPRDPIRLKGLPEPVRPRRVVPDGEDPVAQLIALKAVPPKPEPAGPKWLPARLRRRPALAAVAAVVLLAVVAAAVLLVVGSSGSSLAALDENVVGVLDAGSADLVAQTAIGGSPAGVAVDVDAVWVTDIDSGTVSRVDRATHAVTQRTKVGQSPTGVLVAAGSVWVANSGDGTVSRLSLDGQVVDKIDVGSGPTALAYDNATVWVTDTSANAVFGIDPKSGRVRRLAAVGNAPTGIAAADGQLWVTASVSGTVFDIDEKSGEIQQRVQLGNDPRGVAVAGSTVWVANNLNGTVTRINASSGLAGASLPVGAAPTAVVATPDAVWVASSVSRQVTEIDPRTNQVVATTSTGSTPTALALAGADVWVAAASNPALHRGGTLTVTASEKVSLDPARGYDPVSEPVDAMLYDGLVAFRREPGAAGGVVVPDLAQALPTVNDDGLTYAFRLRPDLVWSTGDPVTGADVKHGLERAVASRETTLYDGIVGAKSCTPKHCDLSDGVKVDPTTNAVEIHLTRPDPEFLYKLAVPVAPAAPADAPLADLGDRVLPSTGPYEVAEHTKHEVTLVRNPRFREWSAAAQPAGFPDRIDLTVVRLTAKPAPTTDWATGVQLGGNVGALAAKYGDRLRTSDELADWSLFLNPAVPPFNNVRARRAVAYAIDRAQVAKGWFEPGEVACTMLPPGVPGYQPYCPYTLHPGPDGEWTAQDINKANKLVGRSGTRGTHVSVYAGVDFPGMETVVDALNQIGYHAKLVPVGVPYFDSLAAKVPRPQAGLNGWLADYPAASNFLQSQLGCGSASNPDGYCDRSLNAQMDAALRLQVDSPAAATARWSAIDREVVDKAFIVPLLNSTVVDVVSERLQHAERNPALGPLYDQAWVH